MKFTLEQTQVVARLYLHYGTPLDQLPYTEVFERMNADFAINTKRVLSLREFYLGLMNLRKAGKLGKIQK